MDKASDLKGIAGWKEQQIKFLRRGRNLWNLQYEDITLFGHVNILRINVSGNRSVLQKSGKSC
jgi:hypothetical protein